MPIPFRHPGLDPGSMNTRSGIIRNRLRSWIPAFAGMTVAFVSPAAAQPAPPAATDYSKASNWLCLPGRSDLCSTPLGTTALNPNGYGSVGQSPVAKNAPIDCFYVYPTVSADSGMNSDLVPNNGETNAVQVQFARFASACRTFAPV